jgi:hypothetical protein
VHWIDKDGRGESEECKQCWGKRESTVADLLATHVLCTGLTKTAVQRVDNAKSVGGKEKAVCPTTSPHIRVKSANSVGEKKKAVCCA